MTRLTNARGWGTNLLSAALLAAPIVLALVGPVHAQGDAKKQIQARYDRWTQAWMKGRMEWLDALLDPGFTSVGMGSTMDRQQFMGMMTMERANTPITRSTSMKIERVLNSNPEEMTVLCRLKYNATGKDAQGMFGPKGRNHTYIFNGVAKDTWIRANRTWFLKRHEETADMSLILDGKPWNPPAPAAPKPKKKHK